MARETFACGLARLEWGRNPGMATTTRKTALLAAALALHVACSYSGDVIGRVAADDGATDARCTITAYDGTFEEDTCQAETAVEADRGPLVPLGGRFRCNVSANRDRIYELRVACPGYRPLSQDFLVESCAGRWFRACDTVDVGTLVVTRSR
jgi:hypothetical protein